MKKILVFLLSVISLTVFAQTTPGFSDGQRTDQLKNGLNIHILCDAYIFGENYDALKGEIEASLSTMGCTFVNRAEDADWVIYIAASARKYNKIGEGNNAQYVVYIDTKLSIDKTTGQRVYEEQLKPVKGMWTISYEQAARDGYKQIAPKLSDIIKRQIQQ